MFKIILLIAYGMATLVSCRHSGIRSDLRQIVGQEIILPDNGLRPLVNGRDTITADFFTAGTKIVAYYDSTACSMCQLGKIYQWEEAKAISIGSRHQLNLVLIFSPKAGTLDQVITSLRTYRFNYPVFIDTAQIFGERNPWIPYNKNYHTFLLDEHNRVVIAGYPINNDKLWSLYKKEIWKRVRQE